MKILNVSLLFIKMTTVTGKYDEDKVMLGFNSEQEAKQAYLKQYDRPGFFGNIDIVDFDVFKTWVTDKSNWGKKIKIKNDGMIRLRKSIHDILQSIA